MGAVVIALFWVAGCLPSPPGGCRTQRFLELWFEGPDGDPPTAPEVPVEVAITVVRAADGAMRTSEVVLQEDVEGRLLVEGDGCQNAYTYSVCSYLASPKQLPCSRPPSGWAVTLAFGGALDPVVLDLEPDESETVCPWDGLCIDAYIGPDPF